MRKKTTDGLFWLLCYGLLWYLLSANSGWYFGLPLVVMATLLAVWLQLRPWHIHLRQVLPFATFFFSAMLTGAWDVARRALHPRRPLEPAWVLYTFSTDDARVQLVCSAVVGLLPGTLASRIDGRNMELHVLDVQQNWQETLTRLEYSLVLLLYPLAPSAER